MNESSFLHGYGLFIGVGNDLPVTEKDAQALHNLFVDPSRCGYSPNNVRLLLGQQATRQNILEGLTWLASKSNNDPDAVVVVYFSGHGGTYQTNHLVPYDYDPADLSQTSVSGIELTEKLRTINSKKLLVLLDCCHAGGMTQAKTPLLKHMPYPEELRSILDEGRGSVLLASSRADELSWIAEPYSQFTWALLEGLSGYGAAKQDGFARIADIALYTAYAVPTRTNSRQHPVLDLSQADNFAIAYYSGGEKAPRKLDESPYLPIPFDPTDERYSGEFRAVMRNFSDVQSRSYQYDTYERVPNSIRAEMQRLLNKLGTLEQKIRENANSKTDSHDSVTASGPGAMAIHSGRDTNINNINVEGGLSGNIIIGGRDDNSNPNQQTKSARPPGDPTTDAPPPKPKPSKE